MALAGMITGLALTSCGGGGGGDGSGNLSGTTIVANGPASACKIKFVEKQKNQTSSSIQYLKLALDFAKSSNDRQLISYLEEKLSSHTP